MFGGGSNKRGKKTSNRRPAFATAPLNRAGLINSFWTPPAAQPAADTAVGTGTFSNPPADASTTPAATPAASTSDASTYRKRATNVLLASVGRGQPSSRKRARESSPEASGPNVESSRSSLVSDRHSSPAPSDGSGISSATSWTKRQHTSISVSAKKATAAFKRGTLAVVKHLSPSSSRQSSPASSRAISPTSSRASSRSSSAGPPPRTPSPTSRNLGAQSSSDSIPLDDGDPNFVDVHEDAPGGARADPEDVPGHVKDHQAKRTRTGKIYRDPIVHFAVPQTQDVLLRELTRHEGLKDLELQADGFPVCAKCNLESGEMYCRTCRKRGLFCKKCFCEDHAAHPLDRVRIWNGRFLAPYSLARAGLVIDLGHDGDACPHRHPPAKITVIHTNGIHEVNYRMCGCMKIGGNTIQVQLMRAGWMPASMMFPRVAVTLEALEAFHALSFQGKVNAYDYYNGLVRLSDGGGVIKIKSCYKAWVRCTRMYRHLRRCKRVGRAQDPKGVAGTPEGGLVIECPACPNPEKNLPEGWEDAPIGMRYLYALLLAIDANFKLKLKDKKATNLPLADGLSFFPREEPYKTHMDKHGVKQLEERHCASEHNALCHANNTTSKRWVVNGVGACICARHLLYRKHGVVDIPNGEKFACMDYCVFKSLGLTAKALKRFVLSYDIVCSWSVNFFKRLEETYGDIYKLADDAEITFVIPKFHIEAHGDDCKCAFNLNFTLGAARTCGEGIEAGWADMNLIGVFTREMSPAHRHEVIEDFMQAINFRKIKTMSTSFAKQLQEALKLKVKQTTAFEKHQATLETARVELWLKEVEDWDNLAVKKGGDSPYREPVSSQSLKDVKDALKAEEDEEMAKSVPLNAMTASSFVSAVLMLEDQKYVVAKGEKKKHLSMQDETSAEIRQTQLFQRMQALEAVQHSYIVGVNDDFASRLADEIDAEIARALAAADRAKERGKERADVQPKHPKPPSYPEPLTSLPKPTSKRAGAAAKRYAAATSTLWLPSNQPPALRKQMVLGDLESKEIRLRIAVCSDALHNLRRALRTRHAMHLETTKGGRAHVSQKQQTRSQTSRSSLASAIKRHGDRYRRSYAALIALDPQGKFESGTWQQTLRPLAVTDQTAPHEDEGEYVHDEEDAGEDGTSGVAIESTQRNGGRGRGGKASEGRKELSWIWQVGRIGARDQPDAADGATEEEIWRYQRVDWARLRARSLRWTEQVDLLCEEMRRVVTTHMRTAEDWIKRGDDVANDPNFGKTPDISRGLIAHAYRQASVYENLAIGCLEKWVPLARKNKLTIDWPSSVADRVAVLARPAAAQVEREQPVSRRPVYTTAPWQLVEPSQGEEDDDDSSNESEDEGVDAIAEEFADDPADDFAAVTDIDSDEDGGS